MKRYLIYLARVFMMTLGAMTQFRVDFVLRILRAGMEVVIALVVINAFYSHLPIIGGFGKYEALLVFGLFYFTGSIVMMIFGQGIDNLFQDIITGQFDRYLTMPIDCQFAAGTRFIFVTNIFRMIFDLSLCIYAIGKLNIQLPVWGWLLVLMSILSGAAIYYCLMFASSILAFWTFSGEAPFLMNSLASVGRYPVEFFPKMLRVVFYAIPLAFVAYIPASVLLGRNQTLALISPLVAVVSLYLVRQLWSAGLKSYSGASV